MDFSAVNFIAECERIGLDIKYGSGEFVHILCPFHDDSAPSCEVSTKNKYFKCRACGEKGTILKLFAKIANCEQNLILADLAKRYDLESDKIIDIGVIENWHQNIWKTDALRQELYNRALTDDDIREHRLGVEGNRITIPIKNLAGLYVACRKYLPGAPTKEKFLNTRKRGKPRLFPVEQLRFDKILVVGGECKAIVAKRQLNPHGIGVITQTEGEATFDKDLLRRLAGKIVWVCLDVDEPGRKAATILAKRLKLICPTVYAPIVLPLDVGIYPKGDINDFVFNGGELLPLLQEAKEYISETTEDVLDDTEPERVSLSKAITAENVGKRMIFRGIVSALDQTPYSVPNEIKIHCDKSEKYCGACPVFMQSRDEWKLPSESSALIELANCTNHQQLEVIQRCIGIPAICSVSKFSAKTHYNVEDLRLSPELEITDRSVDRDKLPAYVISADGLQLNETYEFIGRMYPHPKTQQNTLIISEATTAKDALSNYSCDQLHRLSKFWPKDWSVLSIDEKLKHIYNDLSANVTRIFMRNDLHFAIDLVYHSPMLLNFDGDPKLKGWVEGLIVGDSSQGKSKAVLKLQEHYQLGAIVDMKNATVAGILGGLQNLGKKFFVSWGVMPMHDKRLVVWEELKGASQELISRCTAMRSSGKAELPKIERREAKARTRLLAVSNPRKDLEMGQHNFGVQAVQELIGALEDIRRFDFALAVTNKEIPAETMNMLEENRPQIPHEYESELCRSLILWAWTRDAHQVKFVDGCTEYILKEATKLINKYTDVGVPLVDVGSMREKLARLSASLACRLFSTDETMENVIVYPQHVEYIVEFLHRIYDSNAMGYLHYTRAVRLQNTLDDPRAIRDAFEAQQFCKDVINQMLAKTHIEVADLEDWCGITREEAKVFLSLLVRKQGLVRHGRIYHKTNPFVKLLNEFLEEGVNYKPNPYRI